MNLGISNLPIEPDDGKTRAIELACRRRNTDWSAAGLFWNSAASRQIVVNAVLRMGNALHLERRGRVATGYRTWKLRKGRCECICRCRRCRRQEEDCETHVPTTLKDLRSLEPLSNWARLRIKRFSLFVFPEMLEARRCLRRGSVVWAMFLLLAFTSFTVSYSTVRHAKTGSVGWGTFAGAGSAIECRPRARETGPGNEAPGAIIARYGSVICLICQVATEKLLPAVALRLDGFQESRHLPARLILRGGGGGG